jgi:hypothetical protein
MDGVSQSGWRDLVNSRSHRCTASPLDGGSDGNKLIRKSCQQSYHIIYKSLMFP